MKELKISIDEVLEILEKEFGITNIKFIKELEGYADDEFYGDMITCIKGDMTT